MYLLEFAHTPHTPTHPPTQTQTDPTQLNTKDRNHTYDSSGPRYLESKGKKKLSNKLFCLDHFRAAENPQNFLPSPPLPIFFRFSTINTLSHTHSHTHHACCIKPLPEAKTRFRLAVWIVFSSYDLRTDPASSVSEMLKKKIPRVCCVFAPPTPLPLNFSLPINSHPPPSLPTQPVPSPQSPIPKKKRKKVKGGGGITPR